MARTKKKTTEEKTDEEIIIPQPEEIEEVAKKRKSMFPKKEPIQYPVISKYCRFDEDKILTIRFDEIFNNPNIAYVNTFRINKRNYHNIIETIMHDFDLIIDNVPDFLFFILDIKHDIVKVKEKYIDELLESGTLPKKIKTREDFNNSNLFKRVVLSDEDKEYFTDKIYEILEEEELFEFIDSYIDETYTLNLDEKIDSNPKNDKNDEYAITDRMNKVILKTSVVTRLLIPLICEGILMNPQNDLYLLTCAIMNTFDEGTTRVHNKIYKFVEFRTERTSYSDKIIWNFLERRGIDRSIVITDLYKSLFIEIIPKMDNNRSAVSYFDVVLRNKIKFIFTYSYPINYKSIETNDRELDERDKMEIHLLQKDPYQLHINQISIDEMVKDIDIPEEYMYLTRQNNPFATEFLKFVFNDEGFDVMLADSEQRAKLILLAREDLINSGFNLMAELIMGIIIPNDRRITNRRRLTDKIESSEEGKRFRKKYKDVYPLIENNNPLGYISTIKNVNMSIPYRTETFDYDVNQLILEVISLL